MWLVETVWLCHMLCLASSKFVMVKSVFSQISAFTFFTYYITISRRTEAKYTRNIVIKRNNILNHHHVVCSVLYCAWIWQKDISCNQSYHVDHSIQIHRCRQRMETWWRSQCFSNFPINLPHSQWKLRNKNSFSILEPLGFIHIIHALPTTLLNTLIINSLLSVHGFIHQQNSRLELRSIVI